VCRMPRRSWMGSLWKLAQLLLIKLLKGVESIRCGVCAAQRPLAAPVWMQTQPFQHDTPDRCHLLTRQQLDILPVRRSAACSLAFTAQPSSQLTKAVALSGRLLHFRSALTSLVKSGGPLTPYRNWYRAQTRRPAGPTRP
jgi:hypothetical protein